MKNNKIYVFALLCILLAGCAPYPDDDDYVEDYDIVLTSYDESKDFSSYSTFAIPDRIPILNGPQGEEVYLDENNAALSTLILNELTSSMVSNGYTEVDTSMTPDLLLSLGILSTNYRGAVSNCDWYGDSYYWNWYPGWSWGPGYGWGGYPCWGGSYYSYSFGSLVVDAIDENGSTVVRCNEDDSNCMLDVAWTGFVRGLLEANDQDMNQRVQSSIDQMFIQSPYFKK